MGPLIPLFWTSADASSGVSKPEWTVLFTLGGGVCVTHSRRFPSGATPAGLLGASMAVQPCLPHTCETLVGDQADALPTELSRFDM